MHSGLLVIIPAFNEAATIAQIVDGLVALNFNVLVVDDGSTDPTSELAANAGAMVLRLPFNVGVGGALRAGFRYAVDHDYSSVVQVDADGQHPIHQISDLVNVAQQCDAHLVIGSRYLSSDATLSPSLFRRLAMGCLGIIASRSAGRKLTDSTSGFRIIRQPLLSEFAREFPSYYLGDTFEATVAAARAGYRIVEIPASLTPRTHGRSSTSSMSAILLTAKVLLVTGARMCKPLEYIRLTRNEPSNF